SQSLGRERSQLDAVVSTLQALDQGIEDSQALLALALEEQEESLLGDLADELGALERQVADLEFRRMFSGEMDANNAYLDIQAGSGGTEAQEWAEILFRMYLRWAESKGFTAELMEVPGGDVAGIKSATVHIKGDCAFGGLRTETGLHRLVRKSLFDSGGRRHT